MRLTVLRQNELKAETGLIVGNTTQVSSDLAKVDCTVWFTDWLHI